MKEGKDITDKLRNGLTPEEVIKRLEQAIPYEPPVDDPQQIIKSNNDTKGPGDPSLLASTGALAHAMEFLRAELTAGGKPVKELQKKAIEAGISLSTLRRGRERLRIKPRKEGKPGEAGRWIWELRNI